ncbi:hypothetical protein MJT46_016767 [Ovis ammon polii x Ovis aries]|nr:hypothetical protein MJT46_016767 [Ovis ammon polii x Ovis aries]
MTPEQTDFELLPASSCGSSVSSERSSSFRACDSCWNDSLTCFNLFGIRAFVGTALFPLDRLSLWRALVHSQPLTLDPGELRCTLLLRIGDQTRKPEQKGFWGLVDAGTSYCNCPRGFKSGECLEDTEQIFVVTPSPHRPATLDRCTKVKFIHTRHSGGGRCDDRHPGRFSKSAFRNL